MVKPRSVVRRRFWILFFGVLGAVTVSWPAVEWDLRRIEKNVWNRGEFSGLEARAAGYRWIANNRVTPTHLRGRVTGLLGDLAYHQGEDAWSWYARSFDPFSDFVSGGKWDPALLAQAFAIGHSDFGRGYADYVTSTFHPPPLSDEDLDAPLPEVADAENAWFAFSEIPPIDPAEVTSVRELLGNLPDPDSDDWNRVREICDRHEERIELLSQLGTRFAVPDPMDSMLYAPLPDFARLLMLDALAAWQAADFEKAERSFDAAYRLIGFAEQSRGLVPGLIATALRGRSRDLLLESKAGKPAALLFSEGHLSKPGRLDWILRGEYQTHKTTLESAFTDPSPVGLRLRQRVLEKHRDYYRSILVSLENAKHPGEFNQALAKWMFQHRRLFYRAANGTHAEGWKFAAAIEDITAEIVHRIGVPNLGRLDLAIESIRQDEAGILSGESGMPDELTSRSFEGPDSDAEAPAGD